MAKTGMTNRENYILYSGGASGAESYFGERAEEYGIEEVNFTFEGHKINRSRGVRVLNHEELQKGDVSLDYVSQIMHREYPDTKLFRKILQSIWYQINSSRQIFVVGVLLDDLTVRGGTGWGAEFAKICNKELYLFDQERNSWFVWSGVSWESIDDVKITDLHFCGTGTRLINENAKVAISALFKNSF
jgi:hypothetical protein